MPADVSSSVVIQSHQAAKNTDPQNSHLNNTGYFANRAVNVLMSIALTGFTIASVFWAPPLIGLLTTAVFTGFFGKSLLSWRIGVVSPESCQPRIRHHNPSVSDTNSVVSNIDDQPYVLIPSSQTPSIDTALSQAEIYPQYEVSMTAEDVEPKAQLDGSQYSVEGAALLDIEPDSGESLKTGVFLTVEGYCLSGIQETNEMPVSVPFDKANDAADFGLLMSSESMESQVDLDTGETLKPDSLTVSIENSPVPKPNPVMKSETDAGDSLCSDSLTEDETLSSVPVIKAEGGVELEEKFDTVLQVSTPSMVRTDAVLTSVTMSQSTTASNTVASFGAVPACNGKNVTSSSDGVAVDTGIAQTEPENQEQSETKPAFVEPEDQIPLRIPLAATERADAVRVGYLYDYDNLSIKEAKYHETLNSLARHVVNENGAQLDLKEALQALKNKEADSDPITVKTIIMLEALVEGADMDGRVRNSQFIDNLRAVIGLLAKEAEATVTKAIELTHYDDERRVIEAVSYARYAGVTLFQHGKCLLETIMPDRFNWAMAEERSENTAEALALDNERIHGLKDVYGKTTFGLWLQKLEGATGYWFDASHDVNPPYVRFRLYFMDASGQKRLMTYGRYGTPTIEAGPLSVTEITPEYELFIHVAAARHENILYTNHQTLTGPEGNRSTAIKSLETRHPNYHCLCLPMGDGPLFKSWPAQISGEEYIAALKKAVLNEDESVGITLPAALKKEGLEDKLDEFCELIKVNYFESLEGDDDKKTFTLLFFFYLKMHCYRELNIQHTVSACKDNIDRGGVSSGVDELMFAFLSGQLDTNKAEVLERLSINTAMGPFLVKRQELIPRRQCLLEGVVRTLTMSSMVKDNAEAIRLGSKLLLGMEPLELKVPVDEDQHAFPIPSQMKTLAKYQKQVTDLKTTEAPHYFKSQDPATTQAYFKAFKHSESLSENGIQITIGDESYANRAEALHKVEEMCSGDAETQDLISRLLHDKVTYPVEMELKKIFDTTPEFQGYPVVCRARAGDQADETAKLIIDIVIDDSKKQLHLHRPMVVTCTQGQDKFEDVNIRGEMVVDLARKRLYSAWCFDEF